MALSVPLARPLGAESLLGRDVAALLGEADDEWIRRTLENRLPSTLSWRAIGTVNELYTRKDIYVPDDVVRSHQLVFAVPVREPDGVSTRALIAVVSWAPFQRILDEAEVYLAGIGLRSGYDSCSTAAAIASSVTSSGTPQARYADSRLPQGEVPPRPERSAGLQSASGHESGRRRDRARIRVPKSTPGNHKFAVFRKVDAPDGGQSSAFDWRLGIGVDYSDIFAPIIRLRDVVVLATLAIVVSVALVGVWRRCSVSLSVRDFRLTSSAKQPRAGSI